MVFLHNKVAKNKFCFGLKCAIQLISIQVVHAVVYITATKAECECKQDELDDSDESGQ